jgi:von Willebrand factor type A domain
MTNSVYILLDRSGSMETQWKEALGSINGYVENLPVNTRIVLATFDSVSYDILRDTTAKAWRNLSNDDAMPRGGTPLYDSAARMMWRILDEKPDRAVFLVMTDGDENQSQNFNQTAVKKLVRELEGRQYETIFLGANFDKVGDVAAGFGLTSGKWMNNSTEKLGQNMRGIYASASASYLNTGQAMNFTEEDKKKAV